MKPLVSKICAAASLLTLVVALSGCDAFLSDEQRVARAREHLEQGNYRASMLELKTVLDDSGDNIEARILLATLSLKLGDVESAAKELERAEQSGKNLEAVRALRYEVWLAQRRYDDILNALSVDEQTKPHDKLLLQSKAQLGLQHADEARKSIDAALAIQADAPELLLQDARLRVIEGQSKQALAVIDRLTALPAPPAEAWVLRGEILRRGGDFQAARDAYVQAHKLGRASLNRPQQVAVLIALVETRLALNDATGAEQNVSELVALAPEAGVTHYLRARLALLKNDPTLAVAESQRVLQADPGNVGARLLLAAAHIARGSPEQAESALTQLLSEHPDNVVGRKLLAQVYLGRKQPDAARKILEALPPQAGGDAGAAWLMGSALLQEGSTADGLAYLERSVAAQPDDAARRIDLATAYFAAGQAPRALEILNSLPPQAAGERRSRLLLIAASVAGKDPAAARRDVERLAVQYADDAVVQSAVGQYYLSNGDGAHAEPLLQRSITLDSAAPQPRMALARLFVQRGDLDAASKQLKDILGKNARYEPATIGLAELALLRGERPQAKALLEKSISADPAVIDSRLRLAQLSFEDGELVKARGLLDQALAVTKDRKSTLNAVGGVLMRAGLHDEALARFAAAGAAGSAEGTLNVARARLALGQKDEARAVLSTALASKPDWREAALMMIELDARDGQVDRARERARKLPPSSVAPQEIDGDIYALAGKTADALTAYQAAERNRPNGPLAVKVFRTRLTLRAPAPEESLVKWLNGQPTDGAVRGILANYYHQRGDIPKALMQYEHLAQAGTTDTTVLNNLAWLLHERGDSRALGLARKAYEITPSVAEVADTYGWILVQTGSAEEGLKVLERAAAAAAGNGDVTYHLAVAQASAGRRDRAVATLTELLRSNATFASRGEAERTLQSLASGTP